MLGTPFATASAPVSATEPDAKARRMRSTDSAVTPAAGTGSGGIAGVGTSPDTTRKSPYAMRPASERTYTYVGMAKIIPASRMPRRFPMASRAMNASPSGTRMSCSAGANDVMAATPAAVETATVRT